MIVVCVCISAAAYPLLLLDKSKKLENQQASPAAISKPLVTTQSPSTLTLPSTSTKPSTKPQGTPIPKPLSNRLVEYHINVALQPEHKTLQGSQTLTWQNPGGKPVSELYFHLYPNAFESKKTTFHRESGGKLRQDERKDNSYGSMQINSFTTMQGEDLLNRLHYVQPDDGNVDDHTLVKVSLPSPVPPGKKITLTLGFTVKLPPVFARMGYADDFIMAGQWFPKIAVYEPAGTRGRTEEGWNIHQYHGNSEFYADFGIYDVRINVPSTYTVAATGFPARISASELKETPKDTKTYHFYADDVHDFAWAASPNFLTYEESFSAPNVPGVKIKLYMDPKHKELKTRYMQAAKKSLARYSEWYGPYPYSTLSIIVPPENANGAGGMEYPTLITAWGASKSAPGLELERVVVHEIGHQYWYGMIASNEFEEAWLDEGFTSYSEDKVMEREYGSRPNLPIEASYVTSPEPLKRNSWEYGAHAVYSDNVYLRAKLVLNAIESKIGPDAMKLVLKTYFQRWKFRHPATQDFQAVLEEVTKQSWSDYFSQFVYGGLMLDYTVDRIDVRKIPKNGESIYLSEVLIRQRGAQADSVPVQFHFTDGSTLTKVWNHKASKDDKESKGNKDNQLLFKLEHNTPVDWVRIDPQHSLLLENKHINNFMKTNISQQEHVRWNISIVKIMETLFGWVTW